MAITVDYLEKETSESESAHFASSEKCTGQAFSPFVAIYGSSPSQLAELPKKK